MRIWAAWNLMSVIMYLIVFIAQNEQWSNLKLDNPKLQLVLEISFAVHVFEIFLNGFGEFMLAKVQLSFSWSLYIFTTGYCGIYALVLWHTVPTDKEEVSTPPATLHALIWFRLLFLIPIFLFCFFICFACHK